MALEPNPVYCLFLQIKFEWSTAMLSCIVHKFAYILFMAGFAVHQIGELTETIRPKKPPMFTVWPFAEKVF